MKTNTFRPQITQMDTDENKVLDAANCTHNSLEYFAALLRNLACKFRACKGFRNARIRKAFTKSTRDWRILLNWISDTLKHKSGLGNVIIGYRNYAYFRISQTDPMLKRDVA